MFPTSLPSCKGKASAVKTYFAEALQFIEQHQSKETIISAVVHMDEKTPHMHLCFVPLTEDKRLSAKEIIGNKKKLTWWQDEFWKHMVKKYPDLERGESASETGRTHIPPRLFKELSAEKVDLEKQLSSASKESVKRKLEITQKLSELDELRRTVDAIPDEVIRAYTERKYVHHGRMEQNV